MKAESGVGRRRECAARAMLSSDPVTMLRAATAARHERLDRSMPLSDPAAGVDAYARHLQLMQDWLLPLHAWLADGVCGPARFVDGIAQRLRLIAQDLAQLAPAPATGAAAIEVPPPVRGDEAACRWGVAYVIEGSQLGAAFLQRRLGQRFAPFVPRWLTVDASESGARWPLFLAALRDALRDDAQIESACDGARWAFDRMLARLPAVEARA